MFIIYISTEEPEWRKRYGNKSVSSLIYFITISIYIYSIILVNLISWLIYIQSTDLQSYILFYFNHLCFATCFGFINWILKTLSTTGTLKFTHV